MYNDCLYKMAGALWFCSHVDFWKQKLCYKGSNMTQLRNRKVLSIFIKKKKRALKTKLKNKISCKS